MVAWCDLNDRQRAYLVSAVNAGDMSAAKVVRDAINLERKLRTQEAATRAQEALSAFTIEEINGLAVKLPAGRAYGTWELQRKKARALPMGHGIVGKCRK